MPHNTNSKKRANNKKKGRKDRKAAAALAEDSVSDAWGTTGGGAEVRPPSEFSDEDQSSAFEASKESVYVRYKKSTQRFKELLLALAPPDIITLDSVNALVEATDYVVSRDLKVDNQLVNDLKFSIRVRKRVALEKYGGGDEGHSFFIEILEYCWSFLAPRRKRNRQTGNALATPEACEQAGSVDHSLLRNRFEHLSTDVDDSDLDDEDDLPQTPQPRPTSAGPTQPTLQELISGTDRTNISLFLMTLDELMGSNAAQFSKLKDTSIRLREQGGPASSIVQQMMEASVAVNLTIQNVAALEKAFVQDHPHMDTVYRVFAKLVLVDEVQQLVDVVSAKSPMASQFEEKHAVEFLGDAMECAFRDSSDPWNMNNALVDGFLNRWQFPDDADVLLTDGTKMSVQLVVSRSQCLAAHEAPLPARLNCQQTAELQRFVDSRGVSSHTWLPALFIGSNRSITHTIRLVQCFSSLLRDRKGKLVLPSGSLGVDWLCRSEPSTRIQVDMDDLLLNCILPSVFNQCIEGPVSRDDLLFCPGDLLTAFVHVKACVDRPERPVSWSAAFAIHTMLTAVFEVQEPEYLRFLAETAKNAFKNYFRQLEQTKRDYNAALLERTRLPPAWTDKIEAAWCFVELLVEIPVTSLQSSEQRWLSFWNPYCAGAFLVYLTYAGNLLQGKRLVDNDGQLKKTLHLFNALKQVQAIRPGQIALLDQLDDIFAGSMAIWEGPSMPRKGQFQVRFNRTVGLTGTMTGSLGRGLAPHSKQFEKVYCATTPLLHEALSKSFSGLCLYDIDAYVDFVEKPALSEPPPKRRAPLDKGMIHSTRILSAMSMDEPLLATNLASLGFVLNQFYVKFCRGAGWTPDEEAYFMERARREHFMPGTKKDRVRDRLMDAHFASKILKYLDEDHSVVASEYSKIMIDFFDGIPLNDVFWFTPKALVV